MINALRRLFRDERGNTTVDWTTLTAGVVFFGIAVVYAIYTEGVAPVTNAASEVTSSMKVVSPAALDLKQF